MIFKNINEKFDNRYYNFSINNIDVAQYHWGSKSNIISLLEEIELALHKKDDLAKNIAKIAADISSLNHRTVSAKFYRDKTTNKIILLTEVDVKNFSNTAIFTKEINITAKDNSFSLSIIEINSKEKEKLDKGEEKIPDNWELDAELNKKLNRLLFFV